MVGVFLRIVAMTFFVHPDLKSQYFHGQFLSQGVTNIYKYLENNSQILPYRDSFNYPILTYYFLGSWQWISQLWLGDRLGLWLNDWGPDGYHFPQIFSILLTLKLPYLVIDLVLFTILWKTFTSLKVRNKLVWIWALNPFSLYGIYMIGQFDIIPAGLCLVALLIWHKNKNIFWPLLLLALATVFKSYPILLFPFFLLRIDNWKAAAKSILPMLIGTGMLLTQPQTGLVDRIFLANIDLGYGQKISWFFVIYALGVLLSWQKRHKPEMWFEFLLVPLLVISLSHFNAQWIIWSSLLFIPLLAINFEKYWTVILIVLVGFGGVMGMLADRWMTIGMLTPLNRYVDTYPPLVELLGKASLLPLHIQSMSHGMLLAGAIWILYQSYNHEA